MSIYFIPPETFIAHEVGGYSITNFIDAGAVAQVFRARRVCDGTYETFAGRVKRPEVAAIKLLAAPSESYPEMADFQFRFAREAHILRQLTHPNILPLIDAGLDGETGWFYLVLPFMEHGSLAHALRSFGRPPLTHTAKLLSQIAAGLDFAHAQGYVHRDVKPANILLDSRGAAYLSDFGLARLGDGPLTQRTTTGRVMGSPAYMAPEQFTNASAAGSASDQYSLAMVAYEMVTGDVAYHADTWPALLYKCLNDQPKPPQLACPDLPEPAAAAILTALEKEPKRRFATVDAFARAFTLGVRGEWSPEIPRRSRPSVRIFFSRTLPAPRQQLVSLAHTATAVAPAITPRIAAGGVAAHGEPQRHDSAKSIIALGIFTLLCLLILFVVAIIQAPTIPPTPSRPPHSQTSAPPNQVSIVTNAAGPAHGSATPHANSHGAHGAHGATSHANQAKSHQSVKATKTSGEPRH